MSWLKGLRSGTVALGLAMSGVAGSAEERQLYDVAVGGLRIASLELAVNVENGNYTAKGQVASRGLVGAIASFSYGGTSSGRILGVGRLQPVRYDGVQINNNRRDVRVVYNDGTPTEVVWTPKRRTRDWNIDPAEQGGTLDPISATYALLQDMPRGTACERSIEIYDGHQRSRIRIGPEQLVGEGRLSCAGTYTRVAGYSPARMAEKVDFPFTLFYDIVGGRMRVSGFELESIIGPARVTRK